MNKQTLERLQKNPFYKMSPSQKAEAQSIDRPPMVEFGSVPTHSNQFQKHTTGQVKINRIKKNVMEVQGENTQKQHSDQSREKLISR